MLVAALLMVAAGCSGSSQRHTSGAPSTTSSTSALVTTTTGVPPTSITAVSATTARSPSATGIVYAAPVDMAGHPIGGLPVGSQVSGACESGSDSIADVEVYRCGAGNYVYDPCWADSAGGVLCMESPWDTSVVHMAVPGIPPGVNVASTDLDYPWGVQLTSGARCMALQGAHDTFRSKTIDYACSGGSVSGLYLLRGVNRSTQYWTYQTVINSGSNQAAGPVVSVATAWFAGPAPKTAPACQGQFLSVTSRVVIRNGSTAWLLFKNTSSSTCRLYGYPGVAVLDSSGKQVSQIERTPTSQGSQPTDVLIPPGGAASAVLEGDPDYPNGSCPSYQQLLVTSPNTTASTRVSLGGLVICSNARIDPVEVGGDPQFL